MDTITHSLTGALVASAFGSKRVTNNSVPMSTRIVCGAIAGAFPDIDYFTALINYLSFIANWHRGITHSLFMLPLWALLLGITMALFLKQLRQWRFFVTLCAVVLGSHIFLDVITSWDTQILSPISDYRISLQYAFIIDPLLTTIVFVALSLTMYFRLRWLAIAGICTLTLYITSLAFLHHQALALAKSKIDKQGWQYTKPEALPQPFSPFNWKLIISDDNGHWLSFVNLVKRGTCDPPLNKKVNLWEVRKFYCPKHQLTWDYYARFGDDPHSNEVWNEPGFSLYRKFARIPALYKVDQPNTEICVWFMDLRFLIPGLNTPFRYGMCKHDINSIWKLYRIKENRDSGIEFIMISYLSHEKTLH